MKTNRISRTHLRVLLITHKLSELRLASSLLQDVARGNQLHRLGLHASAPVDDVVWPREGRKRHSRHSA